MSRHTTALCSLLFLAATIHMSGCGTSNAEVDAVRQLRLLIGEAGTLRTIGGAKHVRPSTIATIELGADACTCDLWEHVKGGFFDEFDSVSSIEISDSDDVSCASVLTAYTRPIEVVMKKCTIRASDIRTLSTSPSTRMLILDDSTLDTEAARELGVLDSVKILRLNGCNVGDGVVEGVAAMKSLEYLSVRGLAISDEDLTAIVKGSSSLSIIDVSNTLVTTEGIARAKKLSRSVEILREQRWDCDVPKPCTRDQDASSRVGTGDGAM